MAYKLWLNEEMKKQFKTGTVAAKVLVNYILDNIEGTKINKDLDEVTLGGYMKTRHDKVHGL